MIKIPGSGPEVPKSPAFQAAYEHYLKQKMLVPDHHPEQLIKDFRLFLDARNNPTRITTDSEKDIIASMKLVKDLPDGEIEELISMLGAD